MFRDLSAEEIEVRVQSCTEKGATLLLYKDARCDMRILDEAVSPTGWQREHYEMKGRLFCRVGIHDGDSWIWKSDCGTESNTEAEKGEASDSFKRACVNWGIGRELYTAPFIWVPAEHCDITQGRNGKPQCRSRFKVESITIENKTIIGLEISSRGRIIYRYPASNNKQLDDLGKAKNRLARAITSYCSISGQDANVLKREVPLTNGYDAKNPQFFKGLAEYYEQAFAELKNEQ